MASPSPPPGLRGTRSPSPTPEKQEHLAPSTLAKCPKRNRTTPTPRHKQKKHMQTYWQRNIGRGLVNDIQLHKHSNRESGIGMRWGACDTTATKPRFLFRIVHEALERGARLAFFVLEWNLFDIRNDHKS
uniref:Uncharacterized protein n=1 Tax=Eutreptiella gymnastica TaxID=73025 RepID=A0A7S4G951_9EUGL|mmetsp:Transcript_101423/g.171700  ORF Transcript_101423/g.171700 Transcript_101423/m.171700 type:complete len:130 (-) Transcript_101423:474-863(-)